MNAVKCSRAALALICLVILVIGCAKKPNRPPTPRQRVEQAKFGYDIRGKYAGTTKVGYMTSTGPDTAEYKVSLEIDSTYRLISVSWHDIDHKWTKAIVTWVYPADVEYYYKEFVVEKEPLTDQAEVTLHRIGQQLFCTAANPKGEVEHFSLECRYPDSVHEYFKPQTGELRYDSVAGMLVDTVWAAFPPLAQVAVPREKLAIALNGWAIDTYIKKEYLHNSRKYAGQTVDLRRLPNHDYMVRVPNTAIAVAMTDVTLLVTDPGFGGTMPEGRIDYAADTKFAVSMAQQLWQGVVVFQRDGSVYFKALDRGYVFPLQKAP